MEINIKYGSTRSLLKKLEREVARAVVALEAQCFPDLTDALYNFSVTAYHIKDWLIMQTGISDTEVHSFISSVPVLQACRDICNVKKHFEITRYKPGEVSIGATLTEITHISPNEEGGMDVYGKADLWVDVGGGEEYRVIGFMGKVLEEWERYHVEKGI
jgi:hypothetical protein